MIFYKENFNPKSFVKYTREDAYRLMEAAPVTYKEQHRELKTIYSWGGEAVGFEKGPITYSDKAYIIAKIKNVLDLSFRELEIINLLLSPSTIECILKDMVAKDIHTGYSELEKIKKFLFEVPFEEIPLWIEGLPILVKWRLEIKK